MKLLLGDSLERLRELPADSVDSVVCDPPYGISFMSKRWDYDVPSVDLWREVLRVLKPGGHALIACGTRTQHRMAVNIEDAGFEIRDVITWLYGSGFPKSLSIDKAIDKMHGAKREKIMVPTKAGNHPDQAGEIALGATGMRDVSAPATDDAKRWSGWGTALKPACEFWTLARKPLAEKTVAKQVLATGTGALNVDASRIATSDTWTRKDAPAESTVMVPENVNADSRANVMFRHKTAAQMPAQGRWPANLILDEEAAAALDEQSGVLKSGAMNGVYNNTMMKGKPGERDGKAVHLKQEASSGGASRFFYVAKAGKKERSLGLDKTELVWENGAWEKQDLKLALADMLRLAKVTSDDILTGEFSWNTDGFGSNVTGPCPLALTSTIKTALKLITDLKTWSASPSWSIRESIQGAIEMIEASGSNLAASVASIGQLKLTTTNEKTASVLGASLALLQALSEIRRYARSGNFHSTVKPIKLMEYLVRMITPPGGCVLDCFMGSGSTGVAAARLGFNFIGIEREEQYLAICERRIAHAIATRGEQLVLDDESEPA